MERLLEMLFLSPSPSLLSLPLSLSPSLPPSFSLWEAGWETGRLAGRLRVLAGKVAGKLGGWLGGGKAWFSFRFSLFLGRWRGEEGVDHGGDERLINRFGALT